MKTITCIIVAMAAMCSACSLDSARRAQAVNGLALSAELEKQLKAFQAHEKTAEDYLLYSSTSQQVLAQKRKISQKREDLARASAGAASHDKALLRLTKHVENLAYLNDLELDQEKIISEKTSKLLQPLPSTKESFTAVELKYAAIIKPVPLKVRYSEIKALYDSVKENYDANVKKQKEAELALPDATPSSP